MKHFLKVFFITILSIGIVATLGLKIYLEHDNKKKKEEVTQVIEVLDKKKDGLKERTNVLLLGVDAPERDREGDIPRSDTMMLLSLDPKKNTAFILSIPRDTRVVLPGRRNATKINHAHRFGGAELSIQAARDLLGVPIHHYAVVDYKALYEIVDEVGGVEITVDHPGGMHYEDHAIKPPLLIHLDEGTHLMDGNKAEQYLRYRKGYTEGDLGRVEAQQKFLSVLIDKVLSPQSITKIPKILDTVYDNVQTDLSKKDILELGVSVMKLKPEYIIKDVLVGESMYIGSVSYFVLDEPVYQDQIQYMMAGDYADWDREKFHKRSTLNIVDVQKKYGGQKGKKTKHEVKTVVHEKQNNFEEEAILEEQEKTEEVPEQTAGEQTTPVQVPPSETTNPSQIVTETPTNETPVDITTPEQPSQPIAPPASPPPVEAVREPPVTTDTVPEETADLFS